jgi:putative FmdB family regulatory protein
MPIYPIKCSECGHTEDVFAKVTERHDQKCSKCGGACTIDAGRLTVRNGNREFTTTEGESRMHFFHPDEVQHMREELGTNCIRDDGTVVYANRQEQKKFQKALDQWDAKNLPQRKPRGAIADKRPKRVPIKLRKKNA